MYKKAMKAEATIDAKKRSNVAAAMTLPNRVGDLTQQDKYTAWAHYESELTAYRRDKMDAAEIERIIQRREYATEAEIQALGQDPLDEAEIQARLRDGRIPSKEQRDKSLEYRQCVDEYTKKEGKVTRQAKLKFINLRKHVVIRVMQETHCLLASCNNAGSESVQLGFDPTFMTIDEAGQLTVAALANVLTSFKNWQATYTLGDPKQLPPFQNSCRANEFWGQGGTSVLTLLDEKGYPVLRLVLQYRMAPAISQFVSGFFYDGLLQNSPSVLIDNDLRAKAREISKKEYRCNGPDENGSEYWMIDVVNGVSRVQLNGTSLQNYANASRMATLVDQALALGVKASQINVLVYYTGQLNLVSHKIETTAQANGREWSFSAGTRISSVDSFQGEENEFVFVDIVTAHSQIKDKGHQGPAVDSEKEDDEIFEGFKRSGRVTAHVKSAHRLCCALTRGRSCVVVVCQLAALLSTVKSVQSKANAALGAMAKDFIDRKLVYHDYTSLDTSPIAEETRAKWDDTKKEEELRQRKLDSLDFLRTQSKRAEKVRYTEDFQNNAPKVYRTHTKRTTRLNLSGATVDDAENHDKNKGDRSAFVTKAGAVSLVTGGQTQRDKKEEKEKKAAEKKAAERAAAEKEVAEDPKGKGKGKGKEQEPSGEEMQLEEDKPADPKEKEKEQEPTGDEMQVDEAPADPKGKEKEVQAEEEVPAGAKGMGKGKAPAAPKGRKKKGAARR